MSNTPTHYTAGHYSVANHVGYALLRSTVPIAATVSAVVFLQFADSAALRGFAVFALGFSIVCMAWHLQKAMRRNEEAYLVLGRTIIEIFRNNPDAQIQLSAKSIQIPGKTWHPENED